MTVKDRLYGNIVIDDPLVCALVTDPSFSRLKDVDVAGYYEPYQPNSRYSRFEHSLGVYWLLRSYHARYEEQIAGLLHDISHSAFSHCIDYVLDVGSQAEQSHQDNVFAEYIFKSPIPRILDAHQIDVRYILDDAHFPLKERNIPDLCADRIDYSLRAGVIYGDLSPAKSVEILSDLEVNETDWYFRTQHAAQLFADNFRLMNTKHYSGVVSAVMFLTVGEYLKYALNQSYITHDDLYTTDSVVLEKISTHLGSDPRLQLLWRRMNGKVEYREVMAPLGTPITVKSRIVDPLVFCEGSITRLSVLNPDWKTIVERDLLPKEYRIDFAE